jgi:hypothetical protein
VPELAISASASWLQRQRWLLPAITCYLALRALTIGGLVVGDAFTHERLVDKLTRWDSAWFLRAVNQGWPRHLTYVHGKVVGNPISFFPMLPLAIRWLADATGIPPSVVGLILSGLSGLTATAAIGILVHQFRPEAEARRAALFVALFPASFIFSLIYAEGLALTLITLGLIALLRRRWLLAGLAGLAATFTSPVGLAFAATCLVACGLELRRSRDLRSLAAPLLAPLGFVAYMLWLWRHTGVLDAWRLTERGGWNSYPSLRYPFHLVWIFVSDPIAQVKTTDLLIAGMVFTGLGLYWAYRQRQPTVVLVYGSLAVALAAISSPVGLRPRFILVAFPVVVAWALRLEGRAFKVLVACSAVGWLLLTAFEFYSWAIFP